MLVFLNLNRAHLLVSCAAVGSFAVVFFQGCVVRALY